ncbi:hypothetical protein Tco_1546806, partial [Tanacetum coccineum]
GEVLRLKKSNHFLSGSTTPLSKSCPSFTSFETSDSLLEEFADELALLDPFPPGNEDVDVEADLREIELVLSRDPSTNFSPTITIDPNPERFSDEPALACLPSPGDDDDDKSFLKEDVQEENFQIYSNPLFEFDDNHNSSNINPLFNDILEDVERKDSNVSNFDEPDECFDPGGKIDKINAFMDAYNDSEGDVLEILHNITHNLFPKVFFDHEPQGLKDEPDNNDLMTKDKVFDPGIWEKFFSPSYVRLSSKDRHYFFFTIVFSFGSEDTIFDPGIYAFHFSSLEPVAFESTKPGAQPRHKKHSTSSKQPSVSSKEATKGGSSKAPTSSKTSHSKKIKESSSAMDLNPSQPLVFTLVDTGMHKEDHQATGGLTSLGVTSEARANPQLSSDMSTFNLNEPIFSASFIIHSESASGNNALAVSTAKVDPGKSAPSDFVPQQQGMNERTKNTSYDHLFAGIDPHVITDQAKSVSKGLETVLTQPRTRKGASFIARQVEEEETSNTIKLEDLAKLVSNVQPRFKDLDSPKDDYVIVVDDSDEDEEDEVHTTTNAETKDTSVSKFSSPRSSQIQELTNQTKGKKAISSKEVEKESTNSDSNDDDKTHVTGFMVEPSTTNKLKKFDFITENGRHIHLNEKETNRQKKLEEDANAEAAKQEGEYDRYCDKMLNRRAESRITNYDVLTKKGPIILKVYIEDGTSKVIPNFKFSDLHLGEWREVVKACPNRTGKGWKTIYGQIQTRMDYLHTTEAELGINLDIPLSEQDPLDKLNDLANKKRKDADDIHDYFKANKRLKSSVQYEDHLPELKDFSNTMLYTVQEIFFRRHQGPGLDDHARTFSSFLLAEVDKRNLNPLKQMRTIEQLRQ